MYLKSVLASLYFAVSERVFGVFRDAAGEHPRAIITTKEQEEAGGDRIGQVRHGRSHGVSLEAIGRSSVIEVHVAIIIVAATTVAVGVVVVGVTGVGGVVALSEAGLRNWVIHQNEGW